MKKTTLPGFAVIPGSFTDKPRLFRWRKKAKPAKTALRPGRLSYKRRSLTENLISSDLFTDIYAEVW